MSLVLGELATILKIDAAPLERGLGDAKKKTNSFWGSTKLAAAVAATAIAAAFTAGVVGGMELKSAQAKLSNQLGDPTLSRIAGQAAGRAYGRGFGDSAAEAMQAARAILQSGGLGDDGATAGELEGLTVRAQALAKTFDLDVTQSMSAAGQLVKTGLARNMAEAIDLITRGFQTTGDQSGDLLDTFGEYSTQFRKLGLSGADAMGLMAQASAGGARDLDVAADALKEFAIRAADGSTTSAAGFQALGLNAGKMTKIFAAGGPAAREALGMIIDKFQAMKDPVARETASVALFGTKAEDMQASLLAMDLSTAAGQLGQVSGAAQKMADTFEQDAGQQLEAFKRQVQQAFMEKAAGAIPIIKNVGKFLMEHKEILGPLVGVLGALAVVIGAITVAMKIYTAVQWLANLSLWSFPATWIVLAIIAVIAIFVVLWIKVEGFRNFFIAVGKGIAAAAMWLWNNGIKPAAEGIWWAIQKIGAIAMWLWDNAIKPTVDRIVKAWTLVSDVFTLGWAIFSRIVTSIVALALFIIESAFSPIASAAVWLWQTVLVPVGNGIAWVWQLIAGGATWLWEHAISPALGAIGDKVTWLHDKVFKPVFDKVMSIVSTVGLVFRLIFGAIGGYVSDAFTTALGYAKGGMNGLIGLINSAIGAINTKVIDTANRVPGVNFPHIPTIPRLARGGLIPATPGGRVAVMAEAGEDEYALPASRLRAILAEAVTIAMPARPGEPGEPTVLEAHIHIGDEVVKVVRKEIREQHRALKRRVLAGAGTR